MLELKTMTLSDPAEAGSNPADGCHTGPEKPMLFHIFARTEHAVTGEEVNLRADAPTEKHSPIKC